MSLEAVAGKNPVTHVGKLYNLDATRMARAIVAELPELAAARCTLVSQIGRPVRDPRLVDVEVATPGGRLLTGLGPRIEELIRDHLDRLDALWRGTGFKTPDFRSP
jgi:S-adenosylmethionine synthetase